MMPQSLKLFVSDFFLAVEQGWYLFLSDFQQRYRLTFLGYWWSVVQPLASTLPLIFVGRQFDFGGGTDEVPYEVYAFIGVLFWNVFWSSVTQPLFYARRFRKLLSQYRLSEFAFLTAAGCSVLFNFVISGSLIFLLAWKLDVPLHLEGLGSLLSLPVLALAGFTLAIPLVTVSLLYQDIMHGVGFIGQILLWSAPVVHEIPESGLLRSINQLNPMTYLISVPRDLILSGTTAWSQEFLMITGLVFVAFSICMYFYKRTLWGVLDYVI